MSLGKYICTVTKNRSKTPGTSKMGLFAILFTIMTNSFIFYVGRDPEFTTGICAPYFH